MFVRGGDGGEGSIIKIMNGTVVHDRLNKELLPCSTKKLDLSEPHHYDAAKSADVITPTKLDMLEMLGLLRI